jgi:2'-hydroxyisoflavone reductase
MDVLILGGTRFLGRALVEGARARGHRVTLFHRGKTGGALHAGVERILGDRERDLARLDGRRWDAAFDTCGFVPRVVRASTERLAGRVGHYGFVSTISVYAEPLAPHSDESAAVATLADESAESAAPESYGALKALCERAAERSLPGRVLCARAGLLVGPFDYTDRFSYWVRRIARGGDVLVPDALDQPVQFIDARDAAGWMIRAAESGITGTFNVTGPAAPLRFGAFLEAARAALGSEARFIPVAEDFLRARGVIPWSELPLWTAGDTGHTSIDVSRALARGLEFRALDETLRDTLEGLRTSPPTPGVGSAFPMPASLSAERERELLAEWGRSASAASGR